MAYRKIYLTINAETGKQVDPVDGAPIQTSKKPVVFLNEKVLFCLSFVDSDNAAYPFASADAFDLGIDTNFDHTDDLIAYSDPTKVNTGDWSAETKTGGKLSFRTDLETTEAATKLGASSSLSCYLEVTRFDGGPSGDESIVAQIDITLRNVVIGISGSPPPSNPDYYTAAECDALFARPGFWPNVLDKDLTTPPGSPTDGDTYIVGTGATGAWAGNDGKIAKYMTSTWWFWTPATGWTCWVTDEAVLRTYKSGTWQLAIMMTAASPTANHLLIVDANGQAVDSGVTLSDIQAQLSPMGTWNASTNSPDISGAATGDFFIVSVEGATDLGGITDWKVNDWALKTATGWAKVDNSESGQILMDAGDTFGLLGSKLDANSLEVAAHILQSKVDGSSIERSASGLRVKAGGVTNAMLAGSITYDKLVAAAETALPDSSTTPIVVGVAATYRAFRLLLRVAYGTSYMMASVLICHDGTNANVLAHEVYQPSTGGLTGGKITFAADINTGNVRLLVTTTGVGGASTCKLRTSEAVEV